MVGQCFSTSSGVMSRPTRNILPSARSQRSLAKKPPPTSNRPPVSSHDSWHSQATSGLTYSGRRASVISLGQDRLGQARAGDRRDRVDADVVLAALGGEREAEAGEAELGGAVVGLAEVAVDAGGRGGEEDAAVALLAHPRPRGVGDLERAEARGPA
jgi:hypothetical protein